MHINIFMSSAASVLERDILKSFAAGVEAWTDGKNSKPRDWENLARIGRWRGMPNLPAYRTEYVYEESWQPCDVAVIFGSWKLREKGSHITRSAVATNARKFIVIETPLLNRSTNHPNQYWRVGINGYLNRDAHWPSMSREAAEQRLQEFEISWPGWQHNDSGHVVVALQLPGDASLRGCDINEWAYSTVMSLREHTDREIVIRNHPLCSQRAFADHEVLAGRLLLAGVDRVRFSDGQLVPWEQDLEEAYCTVTYTSGLAVDSIVRGIPTIACDPGNFAWGISTRNPADIESVTLANEASIHTWLRHLSACQWSLKEMREGLAWQHILPVLEKLQ